MRRKIATLLAKTVLLLFGLGFLATGLFAYQLGIDHDPSWGTSRVLLALMGGGCLLSAAALHASTAIQRFITRRFPRSAVHTPPTPHTPVNPRRTALACILGVCVTLAAALWYITCGTWTHWFPYTQYFDQLADAFRAGQLSLQTAPPPELLALDNPYDYRNREGIPYLWDASLYQGKYYYYWGPVPALVAAGAKLFAPVVVEDQVLLFFFYSGLMLFSALTLRHLHRQYFPEAPAWTLFGMILLIGLSTPVFWLINRPSVYETAIAAEQCFLMIGLYAALRALTRPGASSTWLLLTGLAWGAAVNCRLSAAPAVIIFTLILAWVLYRQNRSVRRALPALLLLGAPLLAWAVGLGGYNAARFGSPFETGHRYQLTGMALPPDYSAVTSLSYILPSLYSYLIRPLQFSAHEFPFVFAPYIQESMWPFFIRLPEHYYYPEPLAGMLTTVPVIWLMFLPLLAALRRLWAWLNERPQPASSASAPRWLWALLSAGVVCLLVPLLVFISTSMRYLADVLPFASLLAALGLWWGLRFFEQYPWLRRMLLGLAALLLLVSVAIGLLVNFTNGDKRFQTLNPALYTALANFFQFLP